MRRSRIDYGRLVEGALRTVVRDVLEKLGKEGVLPPHHFYITFRTRHPGVVMPEFLRDRYPVDMTIVLQHQFWDLEVDEQAFSVTLSFSEQLHRLRIPFAAIKVFADPGVEFGLQFTLDEDVEAETPAVEPLPLTARQERPETEASDEAGSGSGGAEIVTLDRFRKK
ncbi:SspB family protein [Benzoatithermus flavus]|uniref:ClpXP protease specificity-enhancing factor SspB n=1 Tax=Benzoatithermus flavus TaxID=3108223 RepID=A0ABU8XXB9_9PROT